MKMRLGSMFVGLALVVLLSMSGAMAAYNDLTGTVLSVSDENSMTINVATSNILGLTGATTILLSDPVSVARLQSYIGKELTFEVLGHDILGRLVCEAYRNGVPIDYVPVKAVPYRVSPVPDKHRPKPDTGNPVLDGSQPGANGGNPAPDGSQPGAKGSNPAPGGSKPGTHGGNPRIGNSSPDVSSP